MSPPTLPMKPTLQPSRAKPTEALAAEPPHCSSCVFDEAFFFGCGDAVDFEELVYVECSKSDDVEACHRNSSRRLMLNFPSLPP